MTTPPTPLPLALALSTLLEHHRAVLCPSPDGRAVHVETYEGGLLFVIHRDMDWEQIGKVRMEEGR